MRIENQLVSLELAFKLKELGVKQKSIHYYFHKNVDENKEISDIMYDELSHHHQDSYNMTWGETDDEFTQENYYNYRINTFYDGFINTDYFKNIEIYSAFTVAELGEIIPTKIYYGDQEHIVAYPQQYSKHEDRFVVSFNLDKIYLHDEFSEANVRAKLIIYLIENKIITLEEINDKFRYST